ncbi:MAG: AAA family ATPase [Pirellulales bacterium]
MSTKELLIVGGPNGAGKSTFVASFLSERSIPYLCADLIATEFQHLDPVSQQIAAGREFLRRMEGQLAKDESFAVETTLSGRSMRSFLVRARAAGFEITIVFICLDSAEMCIQRVKERVPVVDTMFPWTISAVDSPVVPPISGGSIDKLPIIGT